MKVKILLTLLCLFTVSIAVFIIKKDSSLVFRGADLPGQVGVESNGSKISNGIESGFLTYGPYQKLQTGTYGIKILYTATGAVGAKYDVVFDGGKEIVKSGRLAHNIQKGIVSEEIKVTNSLKNNNLEIRVWFDGEGVLELHHIKISGVDYTNKLNISLYLLLLCFIGFLYFYQTWLKKSRARFDFERIIFSRLLHGAEGVALFLSKLKVANNIFILISVLLISILASLMVSALVEFERYKESNGSKIELNTDRFHFFLKNIFVREWLNLTSKAYASDDASNLDTFRIYINPDDIRDLNSDLPSSGKEKYYDAFVKINGDREEKVKLRYRGDNAVHWFYKKKSLRIKMMDKPYKMNSQFNLVNPPSFDSFTDIVNYQVSKDIGLLSPEYNPVRVFINDEFYGVYFFLSQIDESLLRAHKRMPGSIYFGDGSPLENGVPLLWDDAVFWKKAASRNSESENNIGDIESLLSAVSPTYSNKEFYNYARSNIDLDKFYSFFALDVLVGSAHHDWIHNHKLYFDPYKGKFEPIAWDVRFWDGNNEFKDLSVYPLINKVTLNPIFEHERDKRAYELLSSKMMEPEKLVNGLVEKINVLRRDLESDFLRDKGVLNRLHLSPDWLAQPYEISELDDWIKLKIIALNKRKKFLVEVYNDSKISFQMQSLSNDLLYIVLTVEGNSGIEFSLDSFSFDDTLIYKDINFNKRIDSEDVLVKKGSIQRAFPGRKFVNKTLGAYPRGQFGDKHIVNSPLHYPYIAKGPIKKGEVVAKNIITNKKVTAVNLKTIIRQGLSDSIHPWLLPQKEPENNYFRGVVTIDKDLVFDRDTTVQIEPGTTFVMSKGVSIYFYGKVFARGTADQPIKFISANSNDPWGLVAVQGQAASNSVFEFVEFENGSLGSRNLINYTAPFNIHDLDWFEVSNCKIGRNFIGDDAMHVAYSKGVIKNSVFDNARSDALDIDISDVTVTNNVFLRSGNDALDIMTTKMAASNNVFIDTGDKGVSVGEWSEAVITDSIFIRNFIGVEVKDKSKVQADGLVFIDAVDKAINLYNKNQRYDKGGFFKGGAIYFIGNSEVVVDRKSDVTIDNIYKDKTTKYSSFDWSKNINGAVVNNIIGDLERTHAQ